MHRSKIYSLLKEKGHGTHLRIHGRSMHQFTLVFTEEGIFLSGSKNIRTRKINFSPVTETEIEKNCSRNTND